MRSHHRFKMPAQYDIVATAARIQSSERSQNLIFKSAKWIFAVAGSDAATVVLLGSRADEHHGWLAGELGRSIGCERCQTVSVHDASVIFASFCDQSAKHQFGESWTRTRAHGHPYRNRGLLADFAAAFNFASKNCEAGNLFQSLDQPHVRAALNDEEQTMPGRSFRQSGYCVRP